MDLSVFALTDRIAVVTGGGRGLGKAIALGFARAGAHVVVASRTLAEVEQTAQEIRNEGRKAMAFTVDVRDDKQVANLVSKTMDSFGRIDIMVNNAGGTAFSTVLNMSTAVWEADIRENLTSVFIGCRAVGEIMVKQKRGVIINTSSLGALGPWPNAAHYGAAKAGIISLTKSLAVEFAPYVRVNAIAPGVIISELVRKLAPLDSPRRQQQLKSILLARFGTPEDIAGVAIFLASDASSYITGETLPVTGGITTTVFTL